MTVIQGAEDITGLVLAGGRGRRMGGLDKGLQPHQGQPLVLHALQRLVPQVGTVLVSANRHADDYASFGWPVLPDASEGHWRGEPPQGPPPAQPGFTGPLAGFLAGLNACTTPCLLVVPCDVPRFPLDLAHRLMSGLKDADIAQACTLDAQGKRCPQPVFCLMRATPRLRDGLRLRWQAGRHKVRDWIAEERGVEVVFEDDDAFFNINTVADLV